MEVAIAADSKWLVPSFFSYVPVAALDFARSALVDVRRGDTIFVELRGLTDAPTSYTAPSCEAAVSWLSSRLVEAWHQARGGSGTYRPALAASEAEDVKAAKRDAS
jgi:hypothetical protein